ARFGKIAVFLRRLRDARPAVTTAWRISVLPAEAGGSDDDLRGRHALHALDLWNTLDVAAEQRDFIASLEVVEPFAHHRPSRSAIGSTGLAIPSSGQPAISSDMAARSRRSPPSAASIRSRHSRESGSGRRFM